MKRYKATVKFEKCAKSPDFSTELNAADEDLAKSGAKQWARQCGFNGAVKKVTVFEIPRSD